MAFVEPSKSEVRRSPYRPESFRRRCAGDCSVYNCRHRGQGCNVEVCRGLVMLRVCGQGGGVETPQRAKWRWIWASAWPFLSLWRHSSLAFTSRHPHVPTFCRRCRLFLPDSGGLCTCQSTRACHCRSRNPHAFLLSLPRLERSAAESHRTCEGMKGRGAALI